MEDPVAQALYLIREIPEGEEEEIPLGENAAIALRNDGSNTCTATLVVQGSRKNLAEFVPSGNVRFRLGQSFGIEFSRPPVIIIDLPALRKDPKRIMSVFHEIGHAIRYADMEEHECNEIERGVRKMLNVVEKIMYLPEQVRGNLSTRERARIVDDERRAWTNALRLLRGIRTTTGVSLFDLFDDNADLEKAIHTRLSTYENLLLDESLPKSAIRDALALHKT